MRALATLGVFTEHSFLFVSHATQAGLTHVDAEAHTVPAVTATRMVEPIRAAGPDHCIVSSDCGVFLLPPPDEGLREFLLLLETCGIDTSDLRRMSRDNPVSLFRL